MKAAVAYSLLAAEAATVLASDKVVSYSFQKARVPKNNALAKRAGPLSVTLGNAQTLYYLNATVGTPGQPVQMQLDTGSSDVWMTDSSAAFCSQNQYNCEGGTFTPSESSTYHALSTVFNITYVDGTGSVGNYFLDNFELGGTTLDQIEMGLATTTTIGTGIVGVGFAADEAVCNTIGPCNEYPTIVDQMVTQGKINTHAYSLWLDDQEAATGTILFGGVDSAKYHAPLISIPIEKDEYSLAYTSFSVAFTGFTVTRNGQVNTGYTSSGYSQQAILDSGTSLTLVPNDLFGSIQKLVAAQYNQEVGVYIADCSVGTTNATFNFAFGGNGGPVINVPVSEFFTPLVDENGQQATFKNGAAACEFGIEPAGEDPVLFGDTFLRSAYVVYDLDNYLISMANTDFNATGSNIQAITSGTAGVPGVSTTATGGLGGATYTSNPYPGGAQSTATGAHSAVGTSAVPTGALLTQSGGLSGSASSTASAAASSSKGAAMNLEGSTSLIGAAFLALAALL